jgi:hypothetical protein
MAKKKDNQEVVTAERLIAAYMQTALESGAFPSSVYAFCKQHHWEESEFYALFGSFEALRKAVWSSFFDQVLNRMDSSREFDSKSLRDKTLNFFYTFFELLTLNRSYVLMDIKRQHNPLKQLESLSGMRGQIRDLTQDWLSVSDTKSIGKLNPARDRILSEGFWTQFLFLLDFWQKDSSPGFEKTDMAIEKSVNTVFDLLDHTPLDRVIDLGKFLVKERFA